MAAGDYGSFADYQAQNQGLGSLAALLSDIPGLSDLSSLSGDLGSLAAIPGWIGNLSSGNPAEILATILGGPAIGSIVGDLIGAGRASTGPSSATSDIAGASSSTDPVLALLGEGAASLPSGVPISSSSGGASGFSSYFDAARKLEDLARWGPGGIGNPKIGALDATTLKNAMHELGNPGKTDDATVKAMIQAYQSGQQYFTPHNLLTLWNDFNPEEQQIIKPLIGQPGPNNSWVRPSDGIGNTTTGPGPQVTGGRNNPFNLGNQTGNILNLAQLAPLMALLNQGSRFGMGWTMV